MTTITETSTKELYKRCELILRKLGANPNYIKPVLDKLFDSQKQEYFSHGLLKFIDYVEYIKDGLIDVTAEPIRIQKSRFAIEVNGNKSFGTLAIPLIQDAFEELLSNYGFGIVSLTNANHLGRLSHIAQPIVEKGNILIGCVNYRGAGRNVLPFGGLEGRHSTNPFIFAAPRKDGNHFIHDFTTSATSESAIKLKCLTGETVRDGILLTENGDGCNTPGDLFTNPRKAFMTNLGGDFFGYKGWGMSVFADLIGIFVGSNEYPSPGANIQGNTGFFFAFNPVQIFGINSELVTNQIEEYISFVKSAKVLPGSKSIVIPGERSSSSYKKWTSLDLIPVHKSILDKILILENELS